jgi:DNA-binding IclR family transcriptional regulator
LAAVDRVFEVLRLFAEVRPEWTVEEVMQERGISISTAYRDIRALTDQGFLSPVGGGRYVLGPAFAEYDRAIRRSDPLLTTSRPFMRELVQHVATPASSLLCRSYRDTVLCIHEECNGDDLEADRFPYERGLPMPLFKGANPQVILAWLPNRQVRRIYDQNADEIGHSGLGRDWTGFRNTLKQVRKDGFNVAVSAIDSGFVGVAAPVCQDIGGQMEIAGSLSIIIRVNERSDAEIQRLTPLVVEAAQGVELALP